MVEIKIQKLREDIETPKLATPGSAGFDLRSAESRILKKGESAMISTGFKMEMPNGYEAQVRPRGGLAIKHSIIVINSPGTVDSDFRGEVMVLLKNLGEEDFEINKGDRIAQMVINKIELPEWTVVDKLSDTHRGEGGFGHTGVQ